MHGYLTNAAKVEYPAACYGVFDSDAAGHLRVKCPKCKGVHILNLAYFRRVKRRGNRN